MEIVALAASFPTSRAKRESSILLRIRLVYFDLPVHVMRLCRGYPCLFKISSEFLRTLENAGSFLTNSSNISETRDELSGTRLILCLWSEGEASNLIQL